MQPHRYTTTLLLLLVCTCATVHAQRDTLFWFAAPEQSIHTPDFDRPIVLRITAYDAAAQVTIDQPANGGLPVQTVAVAAGGTVNVDLTPWIDVIETKPPNAVLDHGLRMRATAPVSLYYEVVSLQCQCSPEIYVPKGRNALGTAFHVPMQDIMNNNPAYNPTPYSSFDIVATANNTTVTIVPTQALVGHPAGVPFNIVLNAGQCYSAQALGASPAEHPGGSVITSDQPIAVTMKDDLLTGVFGACSDPGGDQLVPDALAGNEYIAVKGFVNAPGDRIMVLGLQNGTSISLNGTPAATVNAGQTWATYFPAGTESMYINASAPVHVLQLTGFGCEIGMAVLPPIICTGSNSVSFTRSSNESLFITLLTRNGDQDDFLYNGAPGVINAADFAPVPGTGGDWVAARLQLSAAQSPFGVACSVANTSGLFHLGYINGGATGGCRFGFFSNYGTVDAQATAVPAEVCVGGELQLLAAGVSQASYAWTGPGGFSSTEQNPVLSGMQVDQAGAYIVTVTVPGCGQVSDTVNVQVAPLIAAAFADPTEVCAGGTVQLDATEVSGASYAWTGPNGFSANEQSPLITDIQPAQGGDYVLAVQIPGCETATDTVSIQVLTILGSSLQLSTCAGDPVTLPDGTEVDQAGVYEVVLPTSSGCDSVVTVTVELLVQDIQVSGPAQLCAGASGLLVSQGAVSYAWEPAASLDDPTSPTPLATPSSTTTYTLNALLPNGCAASGSFTITVPALQVLGQALPPQGVEPLNVLLSATAEGCEQLVWTLQGDTLNSTGMTLPLNGTYTFVIACTDALTGCTTADSVQVIVYEEFTVFAPNAFTPNGDGINDVFLPRGNNISPDSYRMSIFDRWGRTVFESADPDIGWDGRISGNDAPIGVYTYRIGVAPIYGSDGRSTKELQGHVTLVR